MSNIRSIPNYQICRYLLEYLTTYRLLFSLVLFCSILTAITDSAVPILIKPLLDSVFVSKNYDSIELIPLIFTVLFIVRNLSAYFSSYGANWISSTLTVDLQTTIFDKFLKLPNYYYNDKTSSDFISKLTSEITLVSQDCIKAVITFIKDIIIILGILIWMIYLNWELTLLIIMVTPIILLTIQLIYRSPQTIDQKKRQTTENLNQIIKESTRNHKTIILDGGQEYTFQRFQDKANLIKKLNLEDNKINIFRVPLILIIVAIALSAIFFLVVEQNFSKTESIGSFVSYIVSTLIISLSIKQLIKLRELLLICLTTAEKIFSYLDLETELVKEGITPEPIQGKIQFEHVSFYNDLIKNCLLMDFSLSISPGEKIAIVGGSDKTNDTLINLIPRFIKPTNGRILLDGHELTTIKLDYLHSKIGFLLQEITIFNDSIAANIAYGKMRFSTESEIITAAHAAHAIEFIREMPNGMQTLIGKNGIKLSRKQCQHIAIARTLLKNPPILLLDETSIMLDSESDKLMQSALENLMLNRTAIIFAHCKATLEKADRIVVMNHNHIIEIGKHQELLVGEGMYTKLYMLCH